MQKPVQKSVVIAALVLAAAVLLAMFTTAEEVKELGFSYLDTGIQLQRHRAILSGHAGNPWQYRVLTAYMAEGSIRFARSLGFRHFNAVGFILFRGILDTSIFLFSYLYFRTLGISRVHAFIGISVLAWGISYAMYNSDMQFSTYLDVIFYLLAGIAVLNRRFLWVVPITLFASLNRETSGLIPFLALSPVFSERFWSRGFDALKGKAEPLAIFAVSLAIYGLVFVFLRVHYGPQRLLLPFGHHFGFDLLRFNLGDLLTWELMLATLGLIPIVALIGYRNWPPELQRFFWIIVPLWFAIHTLAAVLVETRLLLVPQAMIFIPGLLLFAQRQSGMANADASKEQSATR